MPPAAPSHSPAVLARGPARSAPRTLVLLLLAGALPAPRQAAAAGGEGQHQVDEGRQLRARLRAERQRRGRRLMPGALGLELPFAAARAEVARVVEGRRRIPAARTLLRFAQHSSQGRRLAHTYCRGLPLLLIEQGATRCSADLALLARGEERAAATRMTPWRAERSYRVRGEQSGNHAVDYYFEQVDAAALSDFLEQALALGTPFVYQREATAFSAWAAHFENELARRLPAACQLDASARRWLRTLRFVRALDRRHSYMTPQEYERQRRWLQEIDTVTDVLDSPLGGRPSFAQTVYCVAHAEQERPWALFDAALLVDIAAYEAQAVRRDPRRVLTSEALAVRQILFNAAFARALGGHLMSIPEPGPPRSIEQTVAGTLGEPLRLLHGAALEGELLGSEVELKRAVRLARDLLEPRRADQPIFPSFVIAAASPALRRDAERLYARLSSAPQQDRDLPEQLSASGLDPRAALLLLGGFGANRFYGLLDLSQALVDAGLYAEAGPLFFWGAALHFLLQQKDLERIEATRGYYSLPDGVLAEPDWPQVKNYHFWTEALLGCRLRDAGFEIDTAVAAARVIGRHYRYGMTALYLPYQLYHRGDTGWVWEDNARAVFLHERGSRFGYDLCARSQP